MLIIHRTIKLVSEINVNYYANMLAFPTSEVHIALQTRLL